jgi:radial spoke head protein 4A
VASRKFKYHLTGDLNSKVKSFVSFPGKEMHLLKCQIVRILHSSCIVPKGYYKISENFKDQLEGKITEIDEEFKSPSFEEMKAPEGEGWVHEHAYIYPSGKIIDPTVETQVDRLKGINEDEGYKVKEGEGDNVNELDFKYWKIKVVGDQIMHNRPNGDPLTHAVVLVKNTRWPGTLTVWKEEKFANIYVGYGIKAIGENYFPTQLAKIDKDPADLEEQKEPNPEKEPPKPEEKKEGEEEENKEEAPEE